MKRIFALLLGLMFLFVAATACNNGGTDTDTPAEEESTPGPLGGVSSEDEGPPTFVAPNFTLPEKEADVWRECTCGGGHDRHIIVAAHYDRYYDSTNTDIMDNPNVADPETAQMSLDRVRYVEEKYNVFIEFKNITWEGMIESIPISVMSGYPDADVYLADTQQAIPAVLNNMATAIEDMEGIEAGFYDDLFAPPGQSIVMESMKIQGQDKTYLFRAAELNVDMYMLGYNRDMIQAKGLKDPQDCWYDGEWTWDTFREYCRELTDPTQDIYGYSGYWTNFVQYLCFSNDTAFAAGPQQTVDSPKTLEVLNFIYDLYQVDKSARPWDATNWEINNNLFAEGKSGFWISASWINNEQFLAPLGDAPPPFELGMVPFPVGPSGNAETMPTINVSSGSYYFIPRYIKDAGEVFNIMYDLTNWFDYDLEYRDDSDYLWDRLISEDNINMYMDVVGRPGFDLFEMLNFSSSIGDMLCAVDAEYTAAQYAEAYRQVYQDALDNYFK